MKKIIYPLLILLASSAFQMLNAQNLDRFNGLMQKKQTTIVNQVNNKFGEQQQPGYSTPSMPVTQRTCGHVANEAWLQTKYPERLSEAEFEAQFEQLVAEYNATAGSRSGAVLTIPVVVHVVHNGESVGSGPNISQAQIKSQIDVLNEDYRRTGNGSNNHPAGADVEIEFKMAIFDPQGNRLAEPGIHRINGGRSFWDDETCNNTLKPQTQWNPNNYLNMWTVNFGGGSNGLLGYAQFPNLSNLNGLDQNMGEAKTDGVVMRFTAFGRVGNVDPNYNLGRTATHEVGHWLGLRHIWGDGDCSVDDFCNDTPLCGQPNYECITVNSCSGGANDMIENYMDYTNDACMSIFTNEQKARIRTVMQNSPRRKELLNSTVATELNNSNQPIAFFSANITEACTGTTIQLTDQSNNSPTSWTWNFYDVSGNLLGTFNDKNPSISFNTPGLYTVELIVSNSSGSSTHVEDNFFSILSSNGYVEYIEDFEDDQGLLQDWVVYNPDADRGPALANVSSYGVGSRSVVFDNFSNDDDPTGTLDALISPRLDFSGMSAPYLYFEHAYAPYGGQYSDTLLLFYSTDCGQNFVPFYYKGGNELATAQATENNFVPNSSQWDYNQISLGFLSGQSNVHLAIANYSGWGNNLYLDEISLIDGVDYTNQASQPDFAAGSTTICAGDVVQFQDYTSQFPVQWQWQFQGGSPSTSNAQNPFVQYNQPGTFDVSLNASNFIGGDGIFANDYINVLPLPQITISGSASQVCAGEPITLTASGATTYEWYDQFNGSLMFEGPQVTVTLYQDRSYIVLGENAAGCINATQFTVNVNEEPIPVITVSSGQLTASSGQSYQWFFNGNPVGGNQQSLSISQSGTYRVQVTYASGCTLSSQDIIIDITSLSDLEDISGSMQLYPNPGDGNVNLKMVNALEGEFVVRVSNLLGQQVYTDRLQKQRADEQWDLNLSGLAKGTYLVSVTNGEYRALKKYVKQ